jgi:alanine racemase
MNNPDAYFDMIRPGIIILGHYPNQEEFRKRRIDLKPALSLKTRVSCIKQIEVGESISYRRVYVAQTAETIATASIGYSDGFYVKNTKDAKVIINGRLYPFASLVTSNHILIRIVDDNVVHLDDEVILIGSEGIHSITVEEIICHENISHYRFLTNLNPQLPRYYKNF